MDQGAHLEQRRITVSEYLDEWIQRAEVNLRPPSVST